MSSTDPKSRSSSAVKVAIRCLNTVSIVMLCVIVFASMNSSRAKELKRLAGRGDNLAIVNAQQLVAELSSGAVLLDIRERSLYDAAHIEGSINIPLVELDLRATPELSQIKKIAIFCNFAKSCQDRSLEAGAVTPCSAAAQILKRRTPSSIIFSVGDHADDLKKYGLKFDRRAPRSFSQ